MFPRDATTDDIQSIAQMHVQCWQETYPGLLPAADIARYDLAYRLNLWTKVIATRTNTVSIIDDVGFALIKPQRDTGLRDNFPRELQSLYVLRQSYGTGAGLALLTHVTRHAHTGFTASVLQGNTRAIQFYIKAGGQHLQDVTDQDGITDHVYGWPVPIQLRR